MTPQIYRDCISSVYESFGGCISVLGDERFALVGMLDQSRLDRLIMNRTF